MFDYKQTMDKILREEVESGEVKGASVLVLHRGNEKYFHACGWADAEEGIPMRRDTIIRLYSMTKPITAAAVMVLAERGEVDLWDPVSKYLPAFAKQKVCGPSGELLPVERENTLWDMLNMTSGIPYPEEGHLPGRQMGELFRELIDRRLRGEHVDTQDYLERIGQVPLCFHPGEKWLYGLSADVLGGVIEKVSGKSFGEFLRTELFEPLEMPDTGFFVPREKRSRFAQNYEWNTDTKELTPFLRSHLGEYYGEDVAFESGGAGLVSTLDDYSHFASMMVHKGKYGQRQVLGEKTVELMMQNRLEPRQRVDMNWDSLRGYGYGCLMRVLIDQGAAGSNASLGECGWDGWTGNYVTMDPSEDLVMLYFTQRCAAEVLPTIRKLRMATYASIERNDAN
ncbi:MAG: beta-lactamase family protein [Candidatus Gastranaerophilales bacterium]|nr:beta-lactamase family protein [Candidatus Gastranaerophilales bacterium]